MKTSNKFRRLKYFAALLLLSTLTYNTAYAFCGFYVAKADASLYNEASQVVLVRNEDKTVISMMNDFKGDLKEFAMVIPVPEILQEGQINVGNRALFSRIDSFTAPRLVEYYDEDPCRPRVQYEMMQSRGVGGALPKSATAQRRKGVKVEAEYTIGEYDIVILSATESQGLEEWLIENNYNIPKGAKKALAPYIRQDLKFFVAKVNLKEQAKTGLNYLRPLQFAFSSEKFMLPIRLGMINAKGPQELLLYVITKNGRVETTNYPTKKLPSNMDLPVFIKNDFANFYKDMFSQQVEKEGMKTVFTEYFWDMGWCDPCAADPLSPKELKNLGVFWLKDQGSGGTVTPFRRSGQAVDAVVTRLHLRYTDETFPEDLVFQETKDKQNFQGRYVLRHAWTGSKDSCDAAGQYFENLAKRQEKEAQTLASLTGWTIKDVRTKMGITAKADKPKSAWWKNLWDK
jgi:hypothetical protein